jgi:hypothetical protein
LAGGIFVVVGFLDKEKNDLAGGVINGEALELMGQLIVETGDPG